MRKTILFLITGALALFLPRDAAAEAPVKVACIGDSITYGLGLEDRDRDSYPAQLQRLLGAEYQVGNFGKSGATLLRHGHRPYMEQPEFQEALAFAGDIVVIHLGINDTDPRNWPHFQDEFIGDYLALIDSLRSRNPRARVLVARMTPIGVIHSRFISGTRDWHARIQEAIAIVAEASGAQLIDFYTPLHPYPWLFPDGLHPGPEGAGILAKTVFQALTGQYGGLQMPDIYGDRMVLPRGRVFPIRGRADAGEAVKLTLSGQTLSTTAGADGCWEVQAGPFPAGTGIELRIATPGRSLCYRDIAFGDIWLCSGQSNMEFSVAESTSAGTAAADPDLRLYNQQARWRTDNVVWPAEALDSLNHLDYFRPAGWERTTPETAARFSAVGYHFGKMLRDSLDVPIGLINNAVGGSTCESWIDRGTLENAFPDILRNWLYNDLIMEWARGRAWRNLEARAEGAPARHPYEPCYLYESAIRPIAGFPLTGVLWYQGESNADRLEVHERLFPLLVDSWRGAFGEDLPFYYVQLSSLGRSTWPVFRDSQRRLLGSRERLGMVVSSDLGDPYDVHYREKKPVGERLALLALSDVYGHNVQAQSPLPLDCSIVDGTLRIRFDTALSTSDSGPVSTLEVLDAADGRYHAVAAGLAGESLVIDLSPFRHPVAVRYAWQPYTRANLVGPGGLPASTFRLPLPRTCPAPQP